MATSKHKMDGSTAEVRPQLRLIEGGRRDDDPVARAVHPAGRGFTRATHSATDETETPHRGPGR
jgi:hypothetical protein